VIWQMVVFKGDYDEIKLQTIVIMTSFKWRHHHYVTEKQLEFDFFLSSAQVCF